MSKPLPPEFALAELIEAHYGEEAEPATNCDGSPRLRLQDWQLVEAILVGSTEFVLLRRVRGPRKGVDSLTARERDAARCAATGASNKEIARQMGISDSTVGVLLLRACRKLGASDRDGLIRCVQARSL